MARLFALLVGINEYHPDSNVRKLYGCKRDVEIMAEFLKENYKDLLGNSEEEIKKHLVVLTDAQATRKAVVENFQNHLGQASEKGDIALFYYAGHGSYEGTSVEFERLDPKKQNETIICYDSRLSTSYDLADKELAVLINNISDVAEKVIILDSCHSGSATRAATEDKTKRARHQPSRHDNSKVYKRSLDSYLKELGEVNYYQQLKNDNKPVEAPISRHILFSACDRDQVAEETFEGRGLFSSHLERVLKESPGKPVSYNDLFLQVRRSMLTEGAEQTPKIETLQGFNPNYGFLSLDAVDTEAIPVQWDGNKWILEQGAAHGLPTDSLTIGAIKIKLHESVGGKLSENTIDASLHSVSVEESVLTAKDADTTKKYMAKMDYVPVKMAMPVYLNGSEEERKSFLNKVAKNAKSPFLDFLDTPKGCNYEVFIAKNIKDSGEGGFVIRRLDSKQTIIQYIMEKTVNSVKETVKVLNQIEKWERLNRIEKTPEVLSWSDVTIQFEQVIPEVRKFDTNDIQVFVDEKGGKWEKAHFRFQVNNHTDRKLYYHIVAFLPNFQIYHHAKVELDAQHSSLQPLKDAVLFFPPNYDEFTIHYQLFVSTVELTPSQFEQKAIILGGTRFMEGADGQEENYAATLAEDWFTKHFSITLTKNQGMVSDSDKDLSGITIKGHSNFKAKVSIGGLNNTSRSATTFDQIKMLEAFDGLNIINLSSSRGDMDKSIVALQDIQGVPEDGNIEDNPLQIRMDVPLDEDETLIPITHDGEFILPIGDMQLDEDGKPLVSITQIPEQPEENTRNIARALKFVFLKAAKPTIQSVYQLRWVNFDSEIDEKRTSADLEQKVKDAKRILLLVHGIIGDTKEMAIESKFAHTSTRPDDGFDLILTFDYENLSGPIESISEELNKQLEALGLGANDGKELYIVAHSMGGLVSRYLIETLRGGDDMVDRLLMFGTPNGGSVFSKLPEFLKMLKQMLSLAFTFLPININGIMNLIDQFEKVKRLRDKYDELKDDETVRKIVDGVVESEKYQGFRDRLKIFVTLQQMDPESDFLKALNANPAPSTIYYVVAGDISNYKAQGSSWLGRLIDKIVVRVGKLLYFGTPSDIAVAVTGIKHLPFDPKDQSTVICHHMNYFIDEDSVKKWEEYLFA